MDVVFDLDGTLVDSVRQCVAIVAAMRAARGCTVPVDPVAARACSSLGGERMVARLLGAVAENPLTDLVEFRARYFDTPTPPDAVFPGAPAALAALRGAGARLSVCSAKPHALCERVLDQTGLAPFLARAVGSMPGRPCKPDPAHLWATLAPLGPIGAVCYVGDSEVDHALAVAAGVPLVLMAHGYAAAGHDFGAVPVLSGFALLPEMVLALLDRSAAGRRAAA